MEVEAGEKGINDNGKNTINNKLFLKTQKITSVCEDMEKLEPF